MCQEHALPLADILWRIQEKQISLSHRFHFLPGHGSCLITYAHTSFHLQQGLGQDAASHADSLAHVVASVPTLHCSDVQLASGGDREAPCGLKGLAGEK